MQHLSKKRLPYRAEATKEWSGYGQILKIDHGFEHLCAAVLVGRFAQSETLCILVSLSLDLSQAFWTTDSCNTLVLITAYPGNFLGANDSVCQKLMHELFCRKIASLGLADIFVKSYYKLHIVQFKQTHNYLQKDFMSSFPSTSNFYFISGFIKMELRALNISN